MTYPRREKADHLAVSSEAVALIVVVPMTMFGMIVSLTTNVTADIARITRTMDGGDMTLRYKQKYLDI